MYTTDFQYLRSFSPHSSSLICDDNMNNDLESSLWGPNDRMKANTLNTSSLLYVFTDLPQN